MARDWHGKRAVIAQPKALTSASWCGASKSRVARRARESPARSRQWSGIGLRRSARGAGETDTGEGDRIKFV